MIKFSATVTYQYDTPFSPFTVQQFEKGLTWLKDNNFDSAEICISNYEGVDVRAIKEKLNSYGLGCSTISTGQARVLEGISLIDDNREKGEKAQKRIMEHIDAAKILGSHVTLGLLRGLGTKERLAEQKKKFVEMVKPCIQYAHQQDVIILFECINRYETAMMNSVDDTVEIMEMLGDPSNVGYLWDIFHANIEDADYQKTVKTMGSKLKHVHFADSNRYFPGYGHIDFDYIYDLLKENRFNGHISFECFNMPSVEVVLNESGKFIKKLRER
jgi:sugar phosphate isomerase/epimerase